MATDELDTGYIWLRGATSRWGGGGMIRAFVFDLDGTLVETEELKALSYARAAAELRPALNEGDVIEAKTMLQVHQPDYLLVGKGTG